MHACRANAREVLSAARERGIDGLILCNHYQENYVTSEGAAAFAKIYIEEYYKTAAVAAQMGMRLFFGIEVTALLHENAHILVYGMEPEFLLDHPEIYAYPLEKIYALVHEKGGLVVQAHPYRGGGRVQDLNFLDGVEINCHPLYDDTHCERLKTVAHEAGVFVTCGGDYHADTYRAVCGTYFPADTDSYKKIIRHLKTSGIIRLHVHELRSGNHRDVEFVR